MSAPQIRAIFTHDSIPPIEADLEHTMPNLLGKSLEDGRLELQKVLGIGAYGVVYQAFDTKSPKDAPQYYAAKCLRQKGLDKNALAAQAIEMDLHRKVSDHENILTFHRTCKEHGHLFLIMDYCQGGDLYLNISERQLFYRNDQLIKKALLGIIDAVSHCHDSQVFHRDLKPENILCSAGGTDVRIADFGLATDTFTSPVFGAGSSTHMSPGKPYLSYCLLTSNNQYRSARERRTTCSYLFNPPQRHLGSRSNHGQYHHCEQYLEHCDL